MSVDDSRIFVDVFGDIVAGVRAQYDEANNKEPYYMYGHYRAIVNELLLKDGDDELKFEKYPLVILGIDPEYSETDINVSQYEVSANIYIVDYTQKDWLTQNRFDEKFKTILYPLYKMLLDSIIDSKYISSLGIQDFTPKVEPIPYWGTQTKQGSEAQIVNDPLDALKFKVNNLIVNINTC